MRGILTISCLLILAACGKSADSSSAGKDAAGVGVNGQILLEDYSASLRPDTLLVMKTLGGSLDDSSTGTEQLELGGDGSFSASLSAEDETLAALKAAIKEDGTVDRVAVKSVLGSDASQIDDISDAELIKELNKMIAASEKQGGPIYLLIGAAFGSKTSLATTLEDRADIAQTFRFVGLPGDAGNFIGIPAQSAKADLNLGEVAKDDGDEAAGELEVSTDLFDLTDQALAQLNSIDDVLKGVKNAYINEDWRATPFFLWQNSSAGKAAIDGKYSDPEDASFNGYGFYIGGSDIPFDFEDVCNADESARKTMQLIPPGDLVVKAGDSDTYNVSKESPFENSGTQNFGTQDGSDSCSGDSFYARDDGNQSIMLNFGTGGGIQVGDGIPTGLWYLKYDGATRGIFDLATASPIEADDKPSVFIPAVKATTDSGGFITKLSLQFYFYDRAVKKYVKITDVSTIEKVVTTIEAEVTRDTSTGSSGDATEERIDFTHKGDGVYETAKFKNKFKLTGSASDPESVARDVSMNYIIGDNSYRFEFRE